MNIQKISVNQLTYKGIEQTKRGEPIQEPNLATASDLIEYKIEKQEWKDKFRYDWKVMSAITGAAAVVLLGVMNRRSIKGFINKAFKSKSEVTDPLKKNA